jgi:hypothetical protein
MEKLAAELKKIMPFKDETRKGDLVLIAAKEPQMLVYALVGAIERDQARKAEWWQVTLHMLTVPPQTVVWTLREPQFTGRETFTMGGEGRFIQAVRMGQQPTPIRPIGRSGEGGAARSPLRVIK